MQIFKFLTRMNFWRRRIGAVSKRMQTNSVKRTDIYLFIFIYRQERGGWRERERWELQK